MKIITCQSCGELKPHEAFGLCQKCYGKSRQEINSKHLREWRYKNGSQSMIQNKSCPAFLGVHVAEQVLSRIFKDVEIKPYGHKGYDFICGKGYKVDVKASCINIKSNYWSFKMHKNQIPDYFLCLAFDNRTDLNPIHIWLIPGNVVNDKTGISITESRINKWDEYKLNIDKVVKCCNNLKGDN